MPFFEGGVKGASTRNMRPRCSAGVRPGGSSGGGPPAANFLSATEEKNCGSVRWNSAMASSSAVVGSTVFWAWSWMASKCLLLQRGRAPVVEQNRVERRRVPRRWNAAKYGDVRRARVIRHREPWRQRDGVADGGVRLDPRRADSVVVERVVNQERVVGVRLLDDPLHVVQGERTRALAVAGAARTPIAAERLPLEKLFLGRLSSMPSSAWPGPCERDRSLPRYRERDRDAQRDKLRYGSSHGASCVDEDGEGLAGRLRARLVDRDEH